MKITEKERIVFVCNNFPNLSETFIRNQVDYFINEGFDTNILAAGKLVNNELLENYPMALGLSSNLKKVLFFPAFFLRYLFVNPRALFDSLNVFTYGKEAYYLKNFYAMVMLSNKKCDVLFCHFGRSGNVGAFLKKNFFKNAKLLCMFHGRDIREGIKKGGSIYKPLFSEANNILSISKYNYKHLRAWGAPNIVNHSVGIDTEFFKKTKKSKSSTKNKIRILTVGRLVDEKGYEYALEAIFDLKKKLPKASFVYDIVGEGEKRGELEGIIKEYNLKDCVVLHGQKGKDEILKYYQKSEIFLLPSIAEALPVVIMEAFACCLPVIATDVGSVSEEVINGRNGFLVEPKNSNEISRKLEILINDKKLRDTFGMFGRNLVLEKYDINTLNNKLRRLIRN